MKNPIRNNLIIELHVPDLEVVKNFYSKLGFEVTLDDKLNEKELGYLTMTRPDEMGDTMLNFYGGDERVYGQSFFKQFSKDTVRGYASEVTIVVKNMENLFESVMKAGLEENVVREIETKEGHEHKWKDFRMVDPFGFYLRFTELLDWGQK